MLATYVSVNHVPSPTPMRTTMQLATRTFRKRGSPSSACPSVLGVGTRELAIAALDNSPEVYPYLGANPPRLNRLPAFHSIQPNDFESTTAFFWSSICAAS